MATKDNTIVISAELKELTEKQVNKFATTLTKSISAALKSVSIDFSKIQVANVDKLATRAAKSFEKSFNTALKNIEVNPSKIKSFTVPVTLDLTKAKTQLDEFAKTHTLTLAAALTPAGGSRTATGAATANTPVGILTQGSIDTATAALARHREALRKDGLDTKEVDKATSKYQTTLNKLQATLDNMRRVQEVNGSLNDKEITRLQIRRKEVDELTKALTHLGTAQAKTAAETRRFESFMDSFGFKVGILGFGFGILGGHLQRFSQALTQITIQAGRAIEPLERVHNALLQDPSRTGEQQENIFTELNRLSDLPGANLDHVVKSFRSLASLKLGDETSLAFIEGLTKVTAIAGSGAEGLGRLIDQFRQFELSGVLTKRDVRTIVEQGGGPIANALQAAFGTTDSKVLQNIGAENVIKGLVEQLKLIETPLETVTDKFNKMTNAATRLALSLAPLIRPGLDKLVKGIQTIEPLLASIGKTFSTLEPGTQSFVSSLIVLVPVLAGIAAGFLTLLSAIGIFSATLNQTIGLIKTVSPAAGDAIRTLGVVGAAKSGIGGLFSGMVESLTKLKSLLPSVTALFKPFLATFATIDNFFIKGTSTLDIFVVALAKIAALVSAGPFLSILNVFKSLGGLLPAIARIAGLTTPLGIILNIVLALVTNAGKARDILFNAFGLLSQRLGELEDKFKDITGLSLWSLVKSFFKFILEALNVIVGIVGGALVNVIATIVIQIAEIVGFFTTLVDLIQNPSWDNLGKFFYQLYRATFGWIETIVKLLSATILQVLGETFAKWGATKGFGEFLQSEAAKIRKQFESTGDAASKNLKVATDGVNRLNDSLKTTDESLTDLIDSFNALARARAKQDTSLFRAGERFVAEQRRRASESELDKRIQANPAAALSSIRTTLEASAQKSQAEIATQTADTLKQRYNEIRVLLDRISPQIGKIVTKLPGGREIMPTGTKAWIEALNALTMFIHGGKTDFAEFRRLLDNLNAAAKGGIIDKLYKLKDSDAKKEFADTFIELNKLLESYNSELGKSEEAQTRIREQTETTIQEKERETKDLIKKNQALADSLPIKERIAAIDRELVNLQVLATGAKTYEEAAKLEERRNELIKEKEQLTQKLNTALRTEANQTADINQAQEAQLNQTQIEQQNALALLQLRIDKNKELLDLFKSGFSDVEAFQSRLADIDAQRAAFGLGPRSGATNVRAIGTQLGLETQDILRQNRKLGSSGVGQNTVEIAIEALQRGETLTRDLQNRLNLVAKVATETFNSLAGAIHLNEVTVEKARDALALTKEGSKSQKDAQAELNTYLGIQTKLNTSVAIQLNLLKSVNAIYGANAEIIAENLRKQKEQNAADQVAIQNRLELLKLEQELQAAKVQNQTSGRGGPGLRGIFGQLEEEERRRLAILDEEFTLRKKLIEARILETKEAVNAGTLDATEGNQRIAVLQEQLNLIRQIRNEQSSAAQTTIMDKLIDMFKRFSDSVRSARDELTDFLNTAASGDLALNVLYKGLTEGVSATEIVGAAFATMASVIAEALIRSIRDGENFLDAISSMIGGILIKIGEMLIQMAAMAVIMSFMWGLINGGIFVALAEAAAAVPFAALAAGIGAGLIVAGVAMGGAGGSSAAANANTAAGADRSTGAQRNTFEPNKDPRFVFQKTMLATIQLEIKTDDSQIIKAVINGVNQNGRLTRLIGNRKLEFTV